MRHPILKPLYVALAFLLFSHIGPSALRAENAAYSAAISSIQEAEAKAIVDALADDIFEGREAGSRGGHASGGFIIDRLKKLAVQPAGTTQKFYQVFGAQYRNILVLHEGTDPELKQEHILVTAHYDHVGYGTSRNSFGPTGFIHNGADDNASGTAALMELIEAFATSELTTRRSILFIFFDAEEKGLLGSRHWVNNPTVPLESIPIMINVDMVGRLRDNTINIHGTRSAAGLRQLISRHNHDPDLRLDFTWKNKANSDHYPFYERNIPFVMLHTGLHDDYHRPSDDADKVNTAGIERASRLLFSLTHEFANRDTIPNFRNASRGESEWQRRQRARVMEPAPPRIGLRWNPDDDQAIQGDGLRLTDVVPGYAAQRAGLQSGDRILELAGEKVTSGEAFRGQVLWAKNPVKVVFMRDGQEEPQELTVELDGTPVRLGISFRTDDAWPGVAVVNRVTPGSPAARAGVQLHDHIYRVADKPFQDREEFLALVNGEAAPLSMLVERQGKLMTVSLDVPPLSGKGETGVTDSPSAIGSSAE